jgi:cobalt-zinc-cadmium efflux system outer membrane protein
MDTIPIGLKNPTDSTLDIASLLPNFANWDTNQRFPLPLTDRNGGVIQRAKRNVTQSQVQMAQVERQAVSDVREAHRSCEAALFESQKGQERMTDAHATFLTAWWSYTQGMQDLAVLLAALREDDEASTLRIEARARCRRAGVALNTAVGRRVLP